MSGKAAETLLVKALQYDGLEMPPTGKLPKEDITFAGNELNNR